MRSEHGFWPETIFINFTRAGRLVGLILAVHVPLLALDLVRARAGVFAEMPGYRYLFYAHLAAVGGLAVYLAVHRIVRPAEPGRVTTVHTAMLISVGVFVLLLCTAVTMIDQLINGQITIYVIGVMALSVGIYAPLHVSVPALSLNHALFIIAVTRFQSDPDVLVSHYINATIVVLMAIVIGKLMYDSHRKVYDGLDVIHRQQAELERLAVEDSLTGLFNRRYIDGRLREEFERATRYERVFSVALADLDHFKRVNDTYSHQVGDEVLRRLAAVFRTEIRGVDVVARFGGEEFLLMFPETDRDQATVVCEKIRLAIEHYPWAEVAEGLGVTASFGIAESSGYENAADVTRAADDHLYAAKHGGRNRVASDRQYRA